MKFNLSTQQTQKQIFAPSMQQSIKVLLLPIRDLNMAIDMELQENPLLELEEGGEQSITSDMDNEIQKHILSQTQHPQQMLNNSSNDDIPDEKPIKMDETLEEKLLRQLRMEFSDSHVLEIGEFIIGNIDTDGFLHITIEEIAKEFSVPDIEIIEQILRKIQTFDPIGICARNLSECLLIQSKAKYGDQALVEAILNQYMAELGSRKLKVISKECKVSLDQVEHASRLIAALDPKPARNFHPINTGIYVIPDVFIKEITEGEYRVETNYEYIPRVKINAYYKNHLKNPNISKEEKEFIQEKLKNAINFIKSIEQRGSTIKRIAEYILAKQKEFFLNGHMSLQPMILKDVASVLERNESTISRAINNKYIDTPLGIYPFKYFFSQELVNETGGVVASRSIKEEIRNLIETEEKSSPLSDQKIQDYFINKRMQVARRTISKYRQALKILPSYLRKINN